MLNELYGRTLGSSLGACNKVHSVSGVDLHVTSSPIMSKKMGSDRTDRGMEYKSIGQLSCESGLSTRTLRYYEEEGLIHPRRTEARYRQYSPADERRLAIVVAMRACDIPISTVKELVGNPDADVRQVLYDHLSKLGTEKNLLDAAMERTKAAIRAVEGISKMEEKDAFEILKEQGLQDFEETYGKEARSLYGDKAIDEANERMLAMSKDEWDAKELLEKAIKVQLRMAMATENPESEESRELARMHRKWITIHWGEGYKTEEYLALVDGYLCDPRFVEYYDSAAGEGATEFLVKAVQAAN